MCRKNQLFGVLVLGIGIGFVISCFFESGFFCCCSGLGLLVAGCVLLHKR